MCLAIVGGFAMSAMTARYVPPCEAYTVIVSAGKTGNDVRFTWMYVSPDFTLRYSVVLASWNNPKRSRFGIFQMLRQVASSQRPLRAISLQDGSRGHVAELVWHPSFLVDWQTFPVRKDNAAQGAHTSLH